MTRENFAILVEMEKAHPEVHDEPLIPLSKAHYEWARALNLAWEDMYEEKKLIFGQLGKLLYFAGSVLTSRNEDPHISEIVLVSPQDCHSDEVLLMIHHHGKGSASVDLPMDMFLDSTADEVVDRVTPLIASASLKAREEWRGIPAREQLKALKEEFTFEEVKKMWEET